MTEKERRATLYAMSALRGGICRPDSVGRDVEYMEALAATGHVVRLDNPNVPVFQITDQGRKEAYRSSARRNPCPASPS